MNSPIQARINQLNRRCLISKESANWNICSLISYSPMLGTTGDEKRDLLELQKLHRLVQDDEAIGTWQVKQSILFFKGKIYLPPNSSLIPLIVGEIHGSSHEGYFKTLHHLHCIFYWAKIKDSIIVYPRMWHLPKAQSGFTRFSKAPTTPPYSNTSMDGYFHGFHRWPTIFKRKKPFLLLKKTFS